MSEAQEQTAVIKWSQGLYKKQPDIREKYPELKLLFHIPNGGYRNAIEGKHLKAQGVKPGVPDLCLPVARGHYHGLYIEMKTKTGRERSEQAWWRTELMKQGYCSEVCRGYEHAINVLNWYLGLGVFV